MGINPHTSQEDFGIFFVNVESLKDCFGRIQIAHYRDKEGYSTNFYNKEEDDGSKNHYISVAPRQNGDLYFIIETYFYNIIPEFQHC